MTTYLAWAVWIFFGYWVMSVAFGSSSDSVTGSTSGATLKSRGLKTSTKSKKSRAASRKKMRLVHENEWDILSTSKFVTSEDNSNYISQRLRNNSVSSSRLPSWNPLNLKEHPKMSDAIEYSWNYSNSELSVGVNKNNNFSKLAKSRLSHKSTSGILKRKFRDNLYKMKKSKNKSSKHWQASAPSYWSKLASANLYPGQDGARTSYKAKFSATVTSDSLASTGSSTTSTSAESDSTVSFKKYSEDYLYPNSSSTKTGSTIANGRGWKTSKSYSRYNAMSNLSGNCNNSTTQGPSSFSNVDSKRRKSGPRDFELKKVPAQRRRVKNYNIDNMKSRLSFNIKPAESSPHYVDSLAAARRYREILRSSPSSSYSAVNTDASSNSGINNKFNNDYSSSTPITGVTVNYNKLAWTANRITASPRDIASQKAMAKHRAGEIRQRKAKSMSELKLSKKKLNSMNVLNLQPWRVPAPSRSKYMSEYDSDDDSEADVTVHKISRPLRSVTTTRINPLRDSESGVTVSLEEEWSRKQEEKLLRGDLNHISFENFLGSDSDYDMNTKSNSLSESDSTTALNLDSSTFVKNRFNPLGNTVTDDNLSLNSEEKTGSDLLSKSSSSLTYQQKQEKVKLWKQQKRAKKIAEIETSKRNFNISTNNSKVSSSTVGPHVNEDGVSDRDPGPAPPEYAPRKSWTQWALGRPVEIRQRTRKSGKRFDPLELVTLDYTQTDSGSQKEFDNRRKPVKTSQTANLRGAGRWKGAGETNGKGKNSDTSLFRNCTQEVLLAAAMSKLDLNSGTASTNTTDFRNENSSSTWTSGNETLSRMMSDCEKSNLALLDNDSINEPDATMFNYDSFPHYTKKSLELEADAEGAEVDYGPDPKTTVTSTVTPPLKFINPNTGKRYREPFSPSPPNPNNGKNPGTTTIFPPLLNTHDGEESQEYELHRQTNSKFPSIYASTVLKTHHEKMKKKSISGKMKNFFSSFLGNFDGSDGGGKVVNQTSSNSVYCELGSGCKEMSEKERLSKLSSESQNLVTEDQENKNDNSAATKTSETVTVTSTDINSKFNTESPQQSQEESLEKLIQFQPIIGPKPFLLAQHEFREQRRKPWKPGRKNLETPGEFDNPDNDEKWWESDGPDKGGRSSSSSRGSWGSSKLFGNGFGFPKWFSSSSFGGISGILLPLTEVFSWKNLISYENIFQKFPSYVVQKMCNTITTVYNFAINYILVPIQNVVLKYTGVNLHEILRQHIWVRFGLEERLERFGTWAKEHWEKHVEHVEKYWEEFKEKYSGVWFGKSGKSESSGSLNSKTKGTGVFQWSSPVNIKPDSTSSWFNYSSSKLNSQENKSSSSSSWKGYAKAFIPSFIKRWATDGMWKEPEVSSTTSYTKSNYSNISTWTSSTTWLIPSFVTSLTSYSEPPTTKFQPLSVSSTWNNIGSYVNGNLYPDIRTKLLTNYDYIFGKKEETSWMFNIFPNLGSSMDFLGSFSRSSSSSYASFWSYSQSSSSTWTGMSFFENYSSSGASNITEMIGKYMESAKSYCLNITDSIVHTIPEDYQNLLTVENFMLFIFFLFTVKFLKRGFFGKSNSNSRSSSKNRDLNYNINAGTHSSSNFNKDSPPGPYVSDVNNASTSTMANGITPSNSDVSSASGILTGVPSSTNAAQPQSNSYYKNRSYVGFPSEEEPSWSKDRLTNPYPQQHSNGNNYFGPGQNGNGGGIFNSMRSWLPFSTRSASATRQSQESNDSDQPAAQSQANPINNNTGRTYALYQAEPSFQTQAQSQPQQFQNGGFQPQNSNFHQPGPAPQPQTFPQQQQHQPFGGVGNPTTTGVFQPKPFQQLQPFSGDNVFEDDNNQTQNQKNLNFNRHTIPFSGNGNGRNPNSAPGVPSGPGFNLFRQTTPVGVPGYNAPSGSSDEN